MTSTRARADMVGPALPNSVGGYRERNNVESAFRRVRSDTEFEWVVPHTYRKTVATMLDQTGLSARTIADQLGHSRISITQDVYMGRRAVDESPAAALERFFARANPCDVDTPQVPSASGNGAFVNPSDRNVTVPVHGRTGALRLQGCDLHVWSRRGDSNPQPPVYKS